MNKNGTIITYLPFKKYLILIGIGILIYLGYYFFILKSTVIINIPTTCPSGVIPARIKLTCFKDGPLAGFCRGGFTWMDGTKVSDFPTDFVGGSKEGENINYKYATLDYYKKPINPDGTIGKEIRLKISLVIDPSDSTEDGYKIIEEKCSS